MEATQPVIDESLLERAVGDLSALRDQLNGVIQGKSEVIEMLVVALLANGHVLLEDIPGVGKTTLAKALAQSVAATFNRVQFTPDLLPADILGGSIYNPNTGEFDFRKGPLFCNILLADEINRASPRTQSALLEAMSEQQATIEGKGHALSSPFVVLATQNPIEFHGAYPLPEAQLDRFFVQLELGYPSEETELDILFAHASDQPIKSVAPVLSLERALELQVLVKRVAVEPPVARYIVTLAERTRRDERIKLGVSTRGALMMFRAAQASALESGRSYALPDDVQRMAPATLSHRLILTGQSRYGGMRKVDIMRELLESTRVRV